MRTVNGWSSNCSAILVIYDPHVVCHLMYNPSICDGYLWFCSEARSVVLIIHRPHFAHLFHHTQCHQLRNTNSKYPRPILHNCEAKMLEKLQSIWAVKAKLRRVVTARDLDWNNMVIVTKRAFVTNTWNVHFSELFQGNMYSP